MLVDTGGECQGEVLRCGMRIAECGIGDKETSGQGDKGKRKEAGSWQRAGGSKQETGDGAEIRMSNIEVLGVNNSTTQETQWTREADSWQAAELAIRQSGNQAIWGLGGSELPGC